jgi:hypothetical protein
MKNEGGCAPGLPADVLVEIYMMCMYAFMRLCVYEGGLFSVTYIVYTMCVDVQYKCVNAIGCV